MIQGRRHTARTVQRVYAIGDVHGRFDLFARLMHLIERDQARRLPVSTMIVLLGNIIDHGPEAARMVRGCRTLSGACDRFVVLKGNHEDMMVEGLRGNPAVYSHWLRSGGTETLLSWGVDPSIADGPPDAENIRIAAAAVGQATIDWLAGLPLYCEYDGYVFAHAGIRPGVSLRKQDPEDLLWIADEFLESDAHHGAMIVHGHTTSEKGPIVRPNRIGIDTGAYRTGQLTALGIEDGRTWTLHTDTEVAPPTARDNAIYKAYYEKGVAQALGRKQLHVVGEP